MSSGINTVSPLKCEQLESRENPVGFVSVWAADGVLFVAGDAADNAISIQQNAAGDLFVFGMNGTLVNGQSAIFVGRVITNGLVVDLGWGNDFTEAIGFATWGQMSIRGNLGDDTNLLLGVAAAGIDVNGGAGDDLTYVSRAQAWQMVFDGGSGIDRLHLDSINAPQGFFFFNTEIPF